MRVVFFVVIIVLVIAGIMFFVDKLKGPDSVESLNSLIENLESGKNRYNKKKGTVGHLGASGGGYSGGFSEVKNPANGVWAKDDPAYQALLKKKDFDITSRDIEEKMVDKFIEDMKISPNFIRLAKQANMNRTFDRAVDLMEKKKYKEAKKIFLRLFKSTKNPILKYYCVSWLYEISKDYEKNPDEAKEYKAALLDLAFILGKIARPDYFKKLEEMSPLAKRSLPGIWNKIFKTWRGKVKFSGW